MFTAAPPPGIADRYSRIVDALAKAAAARLVRNYAVTPLLVLLCNRLRTGAVRFAILAARFRAGTLVPPRRRAPRPRNPAPDPAQIPAQIPAGHPAPDPASDPAQPPAAPPRKRLRLPQGRYWLIRLVPEANPFRSQLEHLLQDPEMAALLAACPQARRILRPVCRMLAFRPGPPLEPPPRPKPPRQPRPRKPRDPEHYSQRPISTRTALRRLRALSDTRPAGLRPAGPFWKPA